MTLRRTFCVPPSTFFLHSLCHTQIRFDSRAPLVECPEYWNRLNLTAIAFFSILLYALLLGHYTFTIELWDRSFSPEKLKAHSKKSLIAYPCLHSKTKVVFYEEIKYFLKSLSFFCKIEFWLQINENGHSWLTWLANKIQWLISDYTCNQ